MNYNSQNITSAPLNYQTDRFQDLLKEIIQCCQERMIYESEKFGLPQAELRCLMLFEGERYLTVKVISRKLDVAKSRVTKIIDGLSQKNLVHRTEDPKDGRVKLIGLTSTGKEKCREVFRFLRDSHEKVLLQMAPQERKGILSSLETLRSCMEVVKSQLKL